MGLYQAVAETKMELLVVCSQYQVYGVMPPCSRGKGSARYRYMGLYQGVAGA